MEIDTRKGLVKKKKNGHSTKFDIEKFIWHSIQTVGPKNIKLLWGIITNILEIIEIHSINTIKQKNVKYSSNFTK